MSNEKIYNWDSYYRERGAEKTAWFYPDLDPDMADTLLEHGLGPCRILDLGAGTGAQSAALARRGFSVVATDVSEEAITRAERLSREYGLEVDYRIDDILDSRLDERFDMVFDRGCFHCFAGEERRIYLDAVRALLDPRGWLFLKCFSVEQKGSWGPHRIAPEEILDLFQPTFDVLSITRTVYHNRKRKRPRALFCVMRLTPDPR